MNIEVTIGEFKFSFSRDMGELDELVLNFTKILDNINVKICGSFWICYNTIWKKQDV